MAITIPETMPEDWFGEAEMDRGGIANDPALRHAMEAAYQDGIEELGVERIIGQLKDRCMQAANPRVEEPGGVDDTPEPPTDLPPATPDAV